MVFEPWQWLWLALGAFLIGLSKSGIPGLGILAVVIFTNVLPAKLATGLVLPLLIVGDVFAVLSYRRHAQWSELLRLFPWTALGVVAGFLALGNIDDRQARILIGIIIVGMVGLHLWRARKAAELERRVAGRGAWFAAFTGVMAGFTTQVANAAGPVMVIYLLAMGLPKMEFLGTGAVFFMLLNLFKVPFMLGLGVMTQASLSVNLVLAPAVIAGSGCGRLIAGKIPQRRFEQAALALTFAAAIKLLWP